MSESSASDQNATAAAPEPVSAQPTTIAEEIKTANAVTSQSKEEDGESQEEGSEATAEDGEKTQVAKGSSWLGGWGSYITTAVQQPHLLEQGIAAAYSQLNQVSSATSGATQMVKSKSMEVMKSVSSDLAEVKESVKSATTPILPLYDNASQKITGATSVLKNSIKELDEVTDEMTEAAIDGVTKSVSSFWNVASGYASQMFTEDDLPADSVLVGPDSEPIILDRLQAQLHALANDLTTYTQEPSDNEAWTTWLAGLDLDKRQGEISDLMINNASVRRMYSKLVPADVSHKLFWARYFYKVHLLEQEEAKRQVLRKRAERTAVEEETNINWDDEDEEQSGEQSISEELQEKLLNEYEKELKTSSSSPTTSSKGKKQHSKKDSNGSDDWEKLSADSKS